MAANEPEHERATLDSEQTYQSTVSGLDELLTVEDVATLLKVPKSWVYERTRARGTRPAERLPHLKIGKYVRFDPRAVRNFLLRRSKLA